MEKIIFRKFLYDFLTFFLVVSLSLSLITWIIQSVNYLDFISKDGHGFSVYFGFISLNFPKIFSKIVIFSYFVSLFYTIQKYQSNNEILIFWTNGISRIKLVNFVVKISILITIFQIILVYFLVPKAQDYSRDFISTSKFGVKSRHSNFSWFDPEWDRLFMKLLSEKKFKLAAKMIKAEADLKGAIILTGYSGYKELMRNSGVSKSKGYVRMPGCNLNKN